MSNNVRSKFTYIAVAKHIIVTLPYYDAVLAGIS